MRRSGLRTYEALAFCLHMHETEVQGTVVGLSLVPEPRDAIEDETRRNLFWLSFMLDRLTQAANLWPHAMHEDDCTQVFPVNALNFALGVCRLH